MPELRHSAPQRKRQTTASSRRAGAAARPSCVRAWQVKDENAYALRDASAKVRCMRPERLKIAIGYGSKTAGVVFRGCAYARVGRRHAVSVGDVIDASRP